MKVGEGPKEPVDVVGMRLEEAIKLIKGKKGSEVRLTVKHVDGSISVVPIVRDVVEIEETFAKSALIKDGNKTYGIINLPMFYINFKDLKERNSASDMALEIEKLKKEIENLQIIEVDERFSTVIADNILKELNKTGAIEKRKVVDKVAASIILQTYLDMKK